QNYLLQRDNISNGNYVTIQTLSASSVIGTDPQYATYQATATWRVITSWTITCTPTIKNPVPNATNLNTSRSNIYKTNNPNAVSQTDFASQIIIYPNPTSGVFTLEVGRQTTAARQVEIYNVYGERVYSESIIGRQSSVIDLRAAPSGIYFLQLKTEQGIANKKIIINK
ncbi:MAG: T9SS type A sorting domain-containing protein, partial [Bacteroidetes bacterium]|nr:T9SS type A sorting domain-containing protein [Bacteroidota bacterium]